MTERYNWKAAILAAFLILFGAGFTAAHASLNVSPVRVNLSDSHTKDVIQITNQEDSAKSYEVEVVAWSQTNERREVYSPTEDILAVPPLFSLEPGETQLIRVGMLTDADANTERSYRMFITEIAPPEPEKVESTGITMRLQIGIPVFVAPAAEPTTTLDFIDYLQIEEQLFVQFRNSGNTHIKVTEVSYSAPGSAEKTTSPAVTYILAGKTGYLPVKLPSGDQVGTVSIVTDNLETLEYELPFAQ
jgi:fimbrial chaperone protein